jgi:hypothetical protein
MEVSDKYLLIGQTPVPCEDLMEWALAFEVMDRRVASTNVLGGLCLVSTVFLGLDHAFLGGPPLLFETMAFWRGEFGGEMRRCSTWAEAEAQHARMCREVLRPRSILAYIGRRIKCALHAVKNAFTRLRTGRIIH